MVRFAGDGDIQFGPFAPEDYSRNQSPFSFDGEAECPRFLNELIYPAVPADDADLLQRWAGLALFGYNLPQRFLILDGTPNGGKGTLVRIIQALVGTENTYQLRTELLQERFETYRYRGKTLLIGPDVPGDFLMRKGASMLKVLVGGDPISAEGKGLNGDFAMFGNFNIVASHLPPFIHPLTNASTQRSYNHAAITPRSKVVFTRTVSPIIRVGTRKHLSFSVLL